MEAINLLKTHSYDMIFMDHFMLGMDGVEATDHIRKMDGNPNQYIPIIALTADAVSGVKETLIAAGMDDFLSKPIEIKKAVKIFRKFLKEKE